MKNGSFVSEKISSTSLYELVEDVIRSSLPVALRSHNLIVNEVGEQLRLRGDRDIVFAIIKGIIDVVLTHSMNSYIRVTAKTYTDVMLIHIKDFNIMNRGGQLYGLQHLYPLVKKIRGFAGITSFRQSETTIAVSFPNIKPGA